MSIEINSKTSSVSMDNSRRQEPVSVLLQKDKEKVSPDLESVAAEADSKRVSQNQPVEISRESIADAVGKLQDYADQYKRQLRFSIDDDTGRTVVRLLDSEDNVLRQIPSEEVLKLAKSIENSIGLLFTEQV